MKVVQVSTSDMGGAGIAARRLHESLLSEGTESSLLTKLKFGENTEKHFLLEDTFGREVFSKVKNRINATLRYRLPFLYTSPDDLLRGRPTGYEHFSFPFSEVDLHRSAILRTADIIHLHWVADGMLDYGKFFRKVGKPVIWTLHDMNPFTGGCHHSDGSMEFITDCLDCKQVKGTADERIAFKNLNVKIAALKNIPDEMLSIVTPSRWLGNLSQQSRLFKRFRHFVIPNVVDESRFFVADKNNARQKLGLPLNKKVILFVANDITNPRKGIFNLLSAINRIDGENLLICTVGKFTQELDCNKEVKHFGFVNSDQKMAEIYNSADIYALPSMAENFPNSVIEAFFCGVPVAASNRGGIPEQINDGNGVLFDPESPDSILSALQNLLNRSSSFNGHEIRQEALIKYSKAEIVKQYQQLYTSMLKR